jgi:hypothetical protein
MPKFGKTWFNGYYFGDDKPAPSNYKNSIHRVNLGTTVHRSIRKTHVGGSWVYAQHTVGGITRKSHYLVGETWNTSKAITFQTRRGNGSHGAKLGELYQDKKKHKIPVSINNPQGQPARDAFAQAVLNWQTLLTEEQKIEYYKRTPKSMHMSGYNLYIKEYIKENA